MDVLSGSVLIPFIAAALLAFYTRRAHTETVRQGARLTEGYYRGQGLAWGLAGGLALDGVVTAVTGNALLGIVLGVILGLLFGLVGGMLAERRHRDELRPLNSDEKDTRRFALLLALGAVVLALLAVLGILLASQ